MIPSIHSINRACVRHFGGQKKRFFKGRNTHDPMYLAYTKSLCSAFWSPDNEILQGLKYTGLPIVNFSSFWMPEKAISAMSLIPPIQANWLDILAT
jgi:hypothetical protein